MYRFILKQDNLYLSLVMFYCFYSRVFFFLVYFFVYIFFVSVGRCILLLELLNFLMPRFVWWGCLVGGNLHLVCILFFFVVMMIAHVDFSFLGSFLR